MDSEALFKKIDDIESSSIKSNEKVAALLNKVNSRYKEFVYLGETIRIRATIPRYIRHAMETLQNDSKYESISESETVMYNMLAAMCLEDPYNKPSFWATMDEESGDAIDAFKEVFKIATDSEKDIKNFR